MNWLDDFFQTFQTIDSRLLHGQESGKAVEVIRLAQNTNDFIPESQYTKSFIESTIKSIDHSHNKIRTIVGSSFRTDCIADLIAHAAIQGQLKTIASEELITRHLSIAKRIAKEALERTAFEERITHPSIANTGFLHAYLLPAAFIAYGSSYKDAILLFHAAIRTQTRAIVPAFLTGIWAYTKNAKKPPLISLLIPFLIPMGLALGTWRLLNNFRPSRWWKNGPRLGWRRVINQAKKRSKIYGYGCFDQATEEYIPDYLGTRPLGIMFSEMWSDSSHAYFKELDITIGKGWTKKAIEQYKQWEREAKEPFLAAAIAAHRTCLALSFRTEAASLQEDLLIAIVDRGCKKEANIYKKKLLQMDDLFKLRSIAWENDQLFYTAMNLNNESMIVKCAEEKHFTLEGPFPVPKNMSEVSYQAMKKTMETSLSWNLAPDKLFRFWWILRHFQDPDANTYLALAIKSSPNRMAYEINRHPVQ